MRTGTPKLNAVAIGELSANFMQGPGVVDMKAKVAFINSKTGKTHGWTNHNSWPPAVIAKLKELTDLMEEEVARVQFEDGESTSFGGPSSPSGLGGLSEHLGQDDEPPQV